MNTSARPDVLFVDSFVDQPDLLFDTLLSTVDWDKRMTARQTACFGRPYNYSHMTYPAVAMHSSLAPVADKLAERLGVNFDNCLLNYYATGDNTMGFHSDDVRDLQPGTGVAIVSLGATRDITYRNIADPQIRCSIPLPAGSMLYMNDAVQEQWVHAIRKQKEAGPRISLTWRALVDAPI